MTPDLFLLPCGISSSSCGAGEWLIQNENKKIKGHLDIPEFSFGELEDLQVHALSLPSRISSNSQI